MYVKSDRDSKAGQLRRTVAVLLVFFEREHIKYTYCEVGGGEKTILVYVHDAEGLLELLDGRVGEGVEDVCFLGHLDVLVVYRETDTVKYMQLVANQELIMNIIFTNGLITLRVQFFLH